MPLEYFGFGCTVRTTLGESCDELLAVDVFMFPFPEFVLKTLYMQQTETKLFNVLTSSSSARRNDE